MGNVRLVLGVAVGHGVAVDDPRLAPRPHGVGVVQALRSAAHLQQLARGVVVVGSVPCAAVWLNREQVTADEGEKVFGEGEEQGGCSTISSGS